MAQLNLGRTTHAHSGELVVFLIGMRVNKPWRPSRWLPVFAAMPRMLAELSRDPESGLLSYQLCWGAGGPMVVQHWSSREKLYAYASARDGEHRPAWTAFNRRARGAAGAVGLWHETYIVDRAESMYVDMPTSGLARATSVVPVTSRSDRAAARLARGATQAEQSAA